MIVSRTGYTMFSTPVFTAFMEFFKQFFFITGGTDFEGKQGKLLSSMIEWFHGEKSPNRLISLEVIGAEYACGLNSLGLYYTSSDPHLYSFPTTFMSAMGKGGRVLTTIESVRTR